WSPLPGNEVVSVTWDVTVQREFKKFVQKTRVFSVTGRSVAEAIKTKDIEDSIIYNNFRRIAPEGIIISRDEELQKLFNVVSPEEFVEKYKSVKLRKSDIPLLDLQEEYRYMLEDIDEAILKNVAQAKYILGPQVKELEDKVAEYIGVKHCVGVSSGTDALLLSLRALSIKTKGKEFFESDDEIITTPFTFVATGDTILRSGATPVFVDIDPMTYNIDPVKIRHALSSMPSADKVVGILPVHLYGQACNMDEIITIAREHNLFVVEDVAQAFGGRWKDKKLGSIGTTGTFSFFPSKNLGAFGDAGLVATNDDEIAELVRMLRVYGGRDKYNVDHIGYKARLDTLQAAILLSKFKYINEFNERRKRIAEIYNKGLKDLKGLILPSAHSSLPFATEGHVFNQYTIRLPEGKRDALKKHLKEKGIDAMVYYPLPLNKMKVFEGRCKIFQELKGSEKASREVLSLPIEPLMKEEDAFRVVEAVKEFFNKSP
ncbi:MAG: DegT/DnrJ/EryC1/StrS family aminotransferase, partial [Thermodesulfovibrionales bacterium]|nr:DegT/DnrJ/EryC1/StrS family aminotransferase [Thermodesulfovibrionales bacterium]